VKFFLYLVCYATLENIRSRVN